MQSTTHPSGAATAVRPTDVLYAEHRVIERVLHALAALAGGLRRGAEIDLADARDAVDFIANFADRCHHGKEEAELFPAMERCGLPREVGPTAVMRSEHDEGRAHVRALRGALAAQPFDGTTFARRAGAFVLLLREHIAKEDQVLFPMAEQMLPAAAKADLAAVFRRVDDVEIGAAERARCLDIADRLATRYGEPEQASEASCGGCCGH